jgi:hypothetical protein
MKKLQHLCASTFLTLTLALSVFAGEMTGPSVTATPPPPPPGITSTGEIQTPYSSVEGQMDTQLVSDAESVADVALTLLVGALSVF